MLSAADRAVVASDPALPGLRVLLDPERFLDLLRSSELAPVDDSAAVEYIRYKPGTRCVAGSRLKVGDQFLPIHLVAHGPDAGVKLDKLAERRSVSSALGPGSIAFPEFALSLSSFPNDGRLPSLARLGSSAARERLLRRVFPRREDLWGGELHTLAYKPERRFVAALDVEGSRRALLKFLTPGDFWTARRAPDHFAGHANIARRIGQSKKHGVLALDWLPGELLRDRILEAGDLKAVELAGAALAALHAGAVPDFDFPQKAELDRLQSVASTMEALLPHLAPRFSRLAERVAAEIEARSGRRAPIHGDFYSKQVVLNGSEVGLLDFDRAGAGDPAIDLGLFRAHTERDSIRGEISSERAAQISGALGEGYARAAPAFVDDTLEALWAVAGLLAISVHHFRNREPQWDDRSEATLLRAEEIFAGIRASRAAGTGQTPPPGVAEGTSSRHRLDPALPFLEAALDPRAVTRILNGPDAARELRGTRVVRARLLRHKLGRRAVVRYHVDQHATDRIFVAKLRARGTDHAALATSRALWDRGFDSSSVDGLSTPEPLAAVPELQMCVYRSVPGVPSGELFTGSSGPWLARRVAELAHKLHGAALPSSRLHDLAAELGILRERFERLSRERPELGARLTELMAACEDLGASLPAARSCGIHRDFYPDQILVDGFRLQLLDLDLYCEGDPALDVGNFAAHLTELSLRVLGDPGALRSCERALEDRYLELSDDASFEAIRAYRLLSLARHVSISSQLPERRHLTQALLELCEQGFGLGAS